MVKLVSNGLVYGRKDIAAGESFEATPVDADYLVNNGQASRAEAEQPKRAAPKAEPKAEPAADPAAESSDEPKADDFVMSAKRRYTRRDMTAKDE